MLAGDSSRTGFGMVSPMESRRTRRPTFTAEERLERRREQHRRRHASTSSLDTSYLIFGRSRPWSAERVVCVCLLVCLSAFYRPHDICPLCGAASEWPREQEPSSRAAPRAARAQAYTARARARIPYNFSTKKS